MKGWQIPQRAIADGSAGGGTNPHNYKMKFSIS